MSTSYSSTMTGAQTLAEYSYDGLTALVATATATWDDTPHTQTVEVFLTGADQADNTFLSSDAPIAGVSPAVGAPVNIVQFNDVLYLTDGTNPVTKITPQPGSTLPVVEALTDQHAPVNTVAMGLVASASATSIANMSVPGGIPGEYGYGTGGLGSSGTLALDNSYTANTVRNYTATGGYHGQSSNGKPAYPSDFFAPNLFNMTMWQFDSADPCHGMGVRQLIAQTGADGTVHPVLAAEILTSNAGGGLVEEGWVMQQLPTSVDLSTVDSVVISFQILASTTANAVPQLYLCLGSEIKKDSNGYLTTDNDIPINMTGISPNATVGAWTTQTVYLSGAPNPSTLSKVQFIGIRFSCQNCVPNTGTPKTIDSVARVYEDNTALGWRFMDKGYVFCDDPTQYNAITILLDTISAALIETYFTPGATYNFCYTYLYDIGGIIEESSPNTYTSPIVYLASSDIIQLPQSLTFNIPIDTGYSVVGVNLYGMGGHLGATWVQIPQVNIGNNQVTVNSTTDYFPVPSGASNIVLTWTGNVQNFALVPLQQYIEAPPAGATLMIEHQGRLLYAGVSADAALTGVTIGPKGTLYISNEGDPDHVPIGVRIFDTPDNIGGWAEVDLTGQPIVGFGKWGGTTLILYPRGIWRLEGNVTTNFDIIPMDSRKGCASGRTVWPIDDSVTVWLDYGGYIWAATGQGIVEIGRPIRKLIENLASSVFEAAFAVFDPVAKKYLLTLPVGIVANSAITFVLQQDDAGEWQWTEWTGQPGTCAIYATHLATPAVYAADALTAEIVRLNTGLTDEGLSIPWSCTFRQEQQPSERVLKTIQQILVIGSSQCSAVGESPLLSVDIEVTTDKGETFICAGLPFEAELKARWSLPAMTPCGWYQVTVSGTSGMRGAIAAVYADVITRGLRR